VLVASPSWSRSLSHLERASENSARYGQKKVPQEWPGALQEETGPIAPPTSCCRDVSRRRGTCRQRAYAEARNKREASYHWEPHRIHRLRKVASFATPATAAAMTTPMTNLPAELKRCAQPDPMRSQVSVRAKRASQS
jgi:hypothetical protein